ncbi:MAG: GNAT family N-acetyltransferase [Ardenticatenales bacterium]|nr:GNAT family N-acetyltransferase [Ardenticatenales bacterium]
MAEELKIVFAENAAWGVIGPALNDYNDQQAGEDHAQSVCFLLYDADEEIVGGVIGTTYWHWLHVSLMWIKAEYRGLGYGSRLLRLAEEEALQRGARQAYLDTFSFQAPDFYKKHGYHVFGVLEDFPTGHQRYFMTKSLQEPAG